MFVYIAAAFLSTMLKKRQEQSPRCSGTGIILTKEDSITHYGRHLERVNM